MHKFYLKTFLWRSVSSKFSLRKMLKEMGIAGHLTRLLRNLYAGQEVIIRIRHGRTDWFKIGKGVC